MCDWPSKAVCDQMKPSISYSESQSSSIHRVTSSVSNSQQLPTTNTTSYSPIPTYGQSSYDILPSVSNPFEEEESDVEWSGRFIIELVSAFAQLPTYPYYTLI